MDATLQTEQLELEYQDHDGHKGRVQYQLRDRELLRKRKAEAEEKETNQLESRRKKAKADPGRKGRPRKTQDQPVGPSSQQGPAMTVEVPPVMLTQGPEDITEAPTLPSFIPSAFVDPTTVASPPVYVRATPAPIPLPDSVLTSASNPDRAPPFGLPDNAYPSTSRTYLLDPVPTSAPASDPSPAPTQLSAPVPTTVDIQPETPASTSQSDLTSAPAPIPPSVLTSVSSPPKPSAQAPESDPPPAPLPTPPSTFPAAVGGLAPSQAPTSDLSLVPDPMPVSTSVLATSPTPGFPEVEPASADSQGKETLDKVLIEDLGPDKEKNIPPSLDNSVTDEDVNKETSQSVPEPAQLFYSLTASTQPSSLQYFPGNLL